ncbi:hypothetical protein EXE49_01785 [Halorubrum sp. ASP121]|uniref:hypothetical protein n=1 Tax=Halorubrum sp. ASP121 TaxID=1855858 RepID=UPI0010FA5979|nr:hypothetical protein [Halorubrum sp. ASP121]TKX51642.1 hypothetical protein EXE49_01785 [Halorubrum sp. ASP121]
MSDTQGLTALAGMVLLIGIVGLLIGLAMPATSTHTSETCVDSFTGYGQDCVTGSVTTANPMKGPAIGVGVLGIIGGIGILAIGRDSSSPPANREPQQNTTGGFADKLREHQNQSNKPVDSSREEDE